MLQIAVAGDIGPHNNAIKGRVIRIKADVSSFKCQTYNAVLMESQA